MKDLIPLLAILLTISGSAAGLAWFFSERFKDLRHDYKGRFISVYRRIIRIERHLEKKTDFDPSSDLPDLGNGDHKRKSD